MENKTTMNHLIEKILRMPESNIKGFLNISGPAYIEAEKEMVIKSFRDGRIDGYILGTSHTQGSNRNAKYKTSEDYYNKTYANDTTKGLPEENSKRRGWHY